MFRVRRGVVAVAASAALVAAAVGVGVSGATPAAAQKQKKPKCTKSEIVIGQVANATGTASTTWAQDAAGVWEEWVNAGECINGHSVRVETVDTKANPATAQSEVKRLVDTEKVIAIVGENDQLIQAWFPLLTAANIPAIGGTCYYATIICSGPGAQPLFFSATTTVPAITQSGLVVANQLGKKKYGGVVCAEVAACAQVEQIYQFTVPQIPGMQYGGIVKVSASQSDYNAECLKLQQDGVDAAQIATSEPVALRFVQSCATQGYTPQWVLIAGTASAENLEAVNDLIKKSKLVGGIDGAPWWSKDPKIKAMRAAFKKYAPDASYEDSTVTATWAAFELFRKAMENASDTPTSQEVITAMYALRDEDLDGLLPQKLTYTQGQPAPFINCFWTYEYSTKNGIKTLKSSNPSGNTATNDLKSECFPVAK